VDALYNLASGRYIHGDIPAIAVPDETAATVQQTERESMKKIVYAVVLLFAVSLFAAVTFDPDTGLGFVGKGDVQIAFGWNNAQLQSNANNVSFTYDASASYSGVCTWTTGEGTRGERTHNVAHTTSTSVLSALAYDPRQTKGQKQFTGFNLLGFGAVTTDGEIPLVGGPCQGNEGHDGTWSAVTFEGSTGGLYVHFGSQSVLLNAAAPL
jgi:hypothetical protein